jgi:Flp pilus assembly protein protease CpaA
MMEAWLYLEIVRFSLLGLALFYAAYCDYKLGEVSNKLFLYAVVGGLLTIVQVILFGNWSLFLLDLFIAMVTIGVAVGAFFIGGCGGADAKALIMLGVSAPLTPLWSSVWLPLPLVVVVIAGFSALIYVLVKGKKGVSFHKQEVRYLPFILVGFVITVLFL